MTTKEMILLVTLYGGDKSAREVQWHYANRAGCGIPLGAFYLTMNRLEKARFATSRLADATPKRGGNRQKIYSITRDGMKAVDAFRLSVAPQ